MNKDYSNQIKTFFDNFSPVFINGDTKPLTELWAGRYITFDYYKLHYITGGSADVNIFGKTHHIEAGSFMLVPSKTTAFYCQGTVKNIERYWCSVEMNFPKNLIHFSSENIITKCDRKRIEPIFKRLLNSSEKTSVENLAMRKICLFELFSIFFSSFELSTFFVDKKTDFYNTVRNYVDEHLSENLHPKDLAKLMNLEQSYFTRQFKEYFVESPIKYITRLKLQKCAEDLEFGDFKTIEEVANANGYSDYRYFTRIFKKRFGVSPLTYKKLNQKSPQISKKKPC
ncbi:MAG: AraC family transcriptional regulator [Clostridia bacterium]